MRGRGLRCQLRMELAGSGVEVALREVIGAEVEAEEVEEVEVGVAAEADGNFEDR